MKKLGLIKNMFMIGNAHLDPVWLWRWQEGFQEVKATFRSALDRLKEYENFIFTSSSAAYYDWIEKNEPKMFEEIKDRIQEGRWIICGGWWIQPDCNIPSGESYVRQGLIGQNYFKEKFGVTAKVGYNVDSFGHNGMLPQILKKSGMDSYVFMRPGPDEKGLPSRLFLWESKDGSHVTAFRIPFEYCTFDHLENHMMHCKAELKHSYNNLMCFYGVGNHGGGPTKENIEVIEKLNGLMGDTNISFSSPNDFFEQVEDLKDQLPVVHDDLLHHAVGCYSVHSEVKKLNRYSENLMLMAEKFSSIANWTTGQAYPADMNQAWKGVLFNQFHDILAGTSIESAYDDARDLYGESISIAARNMNNALQSLSWNIGIEEEKDMKPMVIFNPHSWPVKVNAEIEYGLFVNYILPEEFIIEDVNGNEIPYQIVDSIAKIPNRKRVVFLAELPPLGYSTYKLRAIKSKKEFDEVKVTDYEMENDRFKLVIDKESGGISSLFDKERQIEVFKDGAAIPVVMNDSSDTWGHGTLRFDEIAGEFKPVQIKKLEEGPVRGVIRVTSKFQSSTIVQDFSMYKHLNKIEVKVKVNWQESYQTLKIKFPVSFNQRNNTYEIPYGHTSRESDGNENPMQNWIDVTGTIGKEREDIYGLSILNDGKYGVDVKGNTISLTVLRSPIYAHHAPFIPDMEEDYPVIDQGIQTFTYQLLPHENSWEDAETVKHALELNQKPQLIVETYHQGSLPQEDSFISIDQSNIILSALKKAENHDDLIIRLYETNNAETVAKVELKNWGRTLELCFGPMEIKTLYIPKKLVEPIYETNLIENLESGVLT
ncbi:alpha-mannosidase [Neobacillus vireti]|uniref:Glycoside hydrolase family protein n=1 Tax=Neobacillus vireti LMG 21834 TaxID=1131730 RepID=A0AB94IKD3_9BACI|nr:alpha-mannosidase [Neobacillus vireti]ETI67526.1 glycoside hydrolase family protein [Neobacillus vireti LMG 21834]KLT18514.1 alpha-mannosidase [Neobacillus vireti]